eukprot:scaffold60037_cov19-Tisochrysis_lutea.AAC.1
MPHHALADEEDALLFGSDEEEGQGFDEDMSSGGRKGKKKASKKVGMASGHALCALQWLDVCKVAEAWA